VRVAQVGRHLCLAQVQEGCDVGEGADDQEVVAEVGKRYRSWRLRVRRLVVLLFSMSVPRPPGADTLWGGVSKASSLRYWLT
jgi:hypothetical protein